MILNASGLQKSYGSLVALADFKLQVEKGQIWGILGPNGSGKTTALGILLGVTIPNKGTFQWFPDDAIAVDGSGTTSGATKQQSPAASRRRIGTILEQPNFYPWLSAYKNLKIVSHIRGNISAEEIEKKLKLVGLWDRKDDLFSKYSLGMKQRLALASAMLGNPDVLVLDEPTNGLDAKAIAEVRETVLAVAQLGKTILMASHILDEVEKICSHVIILQKGNILAAGPIKEVLASGNIFEVWAPDLTALRSKLQEYAECRSVRPHGDNLLAEFGEKTTAVELNEYLFKKGITLGHISRQSHRLESQFLKLLGTNHD